MKKLMAVLVVGMLALAGCTKKPGCVVQDTVSDVLAPVIATTLECSNTAAIKVTLAQLGEKAGLCKPEGEVVGSASPQSFVGEACKLVSGMLVDQIVSQTIPADWGCKATGAKDKLKAAALLACGKL